MSNSSKYSGTTGPQGPQGIQGIQGVQGDPGEGVPVGGTAGQIIEKIDGTDYNTQWVDLSTPSSMDFNFVETDNMPFIEMGNNNNYLTHSVFIFGGTANRGTPTKITVLGNNAGSGKFADVRIRDVTNNQTIAEGLSLVDYNGGVPDIHNMGTISNLSSGAAKWEFQVRKSATNGNKAEIYSLHIDFG